MNQTQINSKIEKIENAIIKIQNDLDNIKGEMPKKVRIKGDPKVEMY